MAINKKLITFDKKATFLGANGINNVSTSTNGYYHNIPEWSMVFILETGEIWHNGVYFGKPIKDQIVGATSLTSKGLVFTPDGEGYYYKTFNLWGNTFDGSLVNINGELLVQGASHKWVYGDAAIKKNNTNLIAFSNDSNNYKVYIPNGDLLVTGGDINVNNSKIILDSTGYISGTHLLNTNSYFNLEYTLGKTWSSIKQFNTSGTQISLDSTRPAIINIQAHSYALNTLWQPWIAGGDIVEQSSWGIGLGGDAFYIGRIAKSHTENSLSQYWKFSDGDGLSIFGTTKYIKALGVSTPETKVFMADGTIKDLSVIGITAVPVLGVSSATTNSTQDTSNSGTYLNIVLNSAKSGGIQIIGAGGTTVKANNGVLTITSTWNAFAAATENTVGVAGYITPPSYADRMKFFRGDNTWQEIEQNVTTELFVGASDGTQTSEQTSNGDVYLIFKEGSDYQRYNIVGSGRTSVTSSSTGAITINTPEYTSFTAATDLENGTAGLVPAPQATQLGSAGYFLRADLSWAIPNDTWKEVTTSQEGYLTRIVTTNNLVESDAPFIYVYKSGVQNSTKGMWVPLPTTAFHDTWTAWVGATDQANGTAGYMPAPTSAQKDLFLKGDGTWVALNNYSLPAATSTALGGVKVGTTLEDETGYTAVHIKDDVIYYKDTTYSFSNLKFQQEAGTDLMTYNSQAARTIVAGDNITFTYSSNVLTIKATDTTYSNFTVATAQAAGKAGLVPGPSANQLGSGGYYLKADGTWDVPTNTWTPADNTNAGYVPKSVKGKYLHANDTTGALEWVDDRYDVNTDKTGVKLGTAGATNVNNGSVIQADSSTGITFEGGTNQFKVGNGTSSITVSVAHGLKAFVKSGSTAAAGLVPKPSTTAGTTKFLREDGTWEVPSYTSLPTFYNLIFNNGTNDVLTYDPDGSASKKIIKGDNITFTVSGNNITIAATNTWNAMTGATSSANGTVGYINAAPPKDGYNTKFWRADGTWAVPSDNNTQYYLTLNGTVNGNSGKTNLGTIWAPSSKGTGFLKCNDGTWSYDNTTYATPDTTTTLSRASGNLTKDTWTDVGTFADTVAEGTWVVSFTADGSIYSGIFSRKKNDTMSEEIDLHAAGTSTKRIYARITGNKFLIVTADDTFNPGAITFNFRKLL